MKKKYGFAKCLSLTTVKASLPVCSLHQVVSILFSSFRIHTHFSHSRCNAVIVAFFWNELFFCLVLYMQIRLLLKFFITMTTFTFTFLLFILLTYRCCLVINLILFFEDDLNESKLKRIAAGRLLSLNYFINTSFNKCLHHL